VAALSAGFGAMPAMTVKSVGYGAGTKDFGIPNVLRVMIGEAVEFSGEFEEVSVLETNIDDLSPQVYEVVMERLFAAGALDVYMTPIQMKKNRPSGAAFRDLRAGEHPGDERRSVRGDLHHRPANRQPQAYLPASRDRHHATKYGPITVKVARRAGMVVNVQPEYEDCKSAAAKHSVPVKMVRDTALSAFWSESA
jgi:uncharacterized protein (DUF111 family)